jgi:hypothetical protein
VQLKKTQNLCSRYFNAEKEIAKILISIQILTIPLLPILLLHRLLPILLLQACFSPPICFGANESNQWVP